MKIAYVTVYDVLDKAAWPKTQPGLCEAGYYISKNLVNDSVSLDYIGGLKKKTSLVTRVKWSFYRHVFNKDYYRWAEPFIMKDYAAQIDRKLKTLNSNIVLCPENALPLAYLQCNQPIVLWTDSVLGGLINFYPYMSNLCQENIKNIQAMEKAALNRCRLAIYASDWAAKMAIQLYGIDPSKIKVIPWGANIESDKTPDDIHTLVESRKSTPCKLLFFGFDWIRKGGSIALEVAKELNRIGLKTELTVVGCKPITHEPLPSFVKRLGFVDKFTQEGWEKLRQLLSESHFLILPSRAECYGHVFCEANSFGVPCLATNVGGIPTVIKDGLNGKTFSLEASISEYCEYILSLMTDYRDYKNLALSSFNEYESRLNWSVAVRTAKSLLAELVD